MKMAALVLAASAATASAHHNIERTYDLKTEVKLEGTIRQFLLRNPHSFLQIEVPDQDGKPQIWAVEFPKGANSLAKQGILPGTLKPDDQVTIMMNPSLRPAERRGNIVTLHRASDGFEWNAKMKQKRH